MAKGEFSSGEVPWGRVVAAIGVRKTGVGSVFRRTRLIPYLQGESTKRDEKTRAYKGFVFPDSLNGN